MTRHGILDEKTTDNGRELLVLLRDQALKDDATPATARVRVRVNEIGVCCEVEDDEGCVICSNLLELFDGQIRTHVWDIQREGDDPVAVVPMMTVGETLP